MDPARRNPVAKKAFRRGSRWWPTAGARQAGLAGVMLVVVACSASTGGTVEPLDASAHQDAAGHGDGSPLLPDAGALDAGGLDASSDGSAMGVPDAALGLEDAGSADASHDSGLGPAGDAGADSGIPPGECLMVPGDLLVTGAQSLAALAGYSCVHIAGALNIHASDLVTLDGLAAVETVGLLSLWANSSLLNTDGLHRLTRAAALSIGSNGALQTARFPSLADVRGLSISHNPALTAVELPLVAALDSVSVVENPVLATLEGLGTWSSLSGDLTIMSNPLIQNEGPLVRLQRVDGSFGVSNNAGLISLSLPSLASAGTFVVSRNAGLRSLFVPVLSSARDLEVSENAVLQLLDLPLFAPTRIRLRVRGNTQLASVVAPGVTAALDVFILDNPVLARVDLSGLVTADYLSIDGQALTELSLDVLETASQFTVNPVGLSVLLLPSLQQLNRATIGGDALGGVDAPHLTSVTGSLSIIGLSLANVALPALTNVADLTIAAGGTAATVLELPMLATAGNLSFSSSGIAALSLPSLVSATSLIVLENGRLVSVQLPLLQACPYVVVARNTALASFEMPAVGPFQHLEVANNAALQAFGAMVGATHVERAIIMDNPVLQTLGLPSLGSVGWFTMTRNPELSTLDLPALVTADALEVTANPMLTGVSGLGALETVTGSLSVSYNSSLGVLGLDSLTAVNSLFIVDNVMLPECLALALRDRLLQENPPGVQFHEIHGNALVCP